MALAIVYSQIKISDSGPISLKFPRQRTKKSLKIVFRFSSIFAFRVPLKRRLWVRWFIHIHISLLKWWIVFHY